MSIERIQSLSCWQSTISCQPLEGGLTNENYLVRDGTSSFVARICDDRRFLGIDRRNERICQQAAHRTGIAPEVFHCEDGILVSRYVESTPMCNETLHVAAALGRIASMLRQLHDSRDRLTGGMLFFCPFQTIRTYVTTARRLAAKLPPNIDELVDDSRRLSHRITGYRPTLCHNDLLAANILDDTNRLWLVDWEYAGIGNPLFDVASISANSGLAPNLECRLLEAYAGSVSPSTHRQLQILKTVSLLREALWAVIQTVKSDLDFDYANYAADNFNAYAEARKALETANSPSVIDSSNN